MAEKKKKYNFSEDDFKSPCFVYLENFPGKVFLFKEKNKNNIVVLNKYGKHIRARLEDIKKVEKAFLISRCYPGCVSSTAEHEKKLRDMMCVKKK